MTRYLDENSGKQIVIETNKALLLKANQSEITSARKGEVDLATKIGKIDSSLSESAIRRPMSVKTKQRNKKSIISFIDDDGYSEVINIWKVIADEKGIKFNSCVYAEPVVQEQSYMMTPTQMLQLQSEGHEILSHGWTRDAMISNVDKSLYHREFGESKMYLKSLGLNINSFVWQGSDYNQEALNTIPYYYDSAWAIDTGYGINKTKNSPFESYKAHRFGFDNATLDSAKLQVDELVANGGWLVFMTHCWNPQWKTAEKQQDLKDLIDYIKSKSIDIVTVKDGLEIHGNIIDYGRTDLGNEYFKVDKQGIIHNKGNRFYSHTPNTVMFTTPPSFFKENSINITYHDGATTATGFPDTNIGTLITEKGVSGTTVQKWYPHITNNNLKDSYYMRTQKVPSAEDSWNQFNKKSYVEGVTNLGYNAITTADRTKVIKNSLNKTQISGSVDIANFPEGANGTLTAGFYGDIGYYSEEYEVRYKGNKYRRTQKSDGTFTPWLQYCFVKRATYSKAFPTLGIGASAQVIIDISGLGLNNQAPIVINFGQVIPAGLIWSSSHNGTNLILNLFNASGVQITGATMSIYCSVILNDI